MSNSYGIKITTIERAVSNISSDLDYLCSLIECPDSEFPIKDALVYARAVNCLLAQLDFAEKVAAENDIDEEGIYFRLSDKELVLLGQHADEVEEALLDLEEICGISLRKN